MYDESGYFDPRVDPNPYLVDDSTSQADQLYNSCNSNGLMTTFSLDDLSNQPPPPSDDHAETAAVTGTDHLQHQMSFGLVDHELQGHLLGQQDHNPSGVNWDPAMQEAAAAVRHHYQQQHEFEDQQNLQQCYVVDEGIAAYGAAAAPPYQAAPDLLNLMHLPGCTTAPPAYPTASSISFGGPSMYGEAGVADGTGPVLYDSSLHLGYPPPPPRQNVLRDLFSSLPQNYGLFCGVEEREAAMAAAGGMGDGCGGGGGGYQEMDGRQFDRNVLDYRRDGGGLGKGEMKGNFVTERHRREQLNEKYKTLRSLIPNPTKIDRASVVGDAIDYIKELGRTVEELKMLVEQKRRRERRILRTDHHDAATAADMESSSMRPLRDQDPERRSWVQRRSKDSFVDVRIIDDEVNIKLNKKKKMPSCCLLSVAKALDELQLDLVHVAGGNIVDHHIFMFNAKICEGSTVHARAIANKLIEVMDRQQQTLIFSDNF